jgi:hypothetical protein
MKEKDLALCSRRNMLAGSALFVAGGVVAHAAGTSPKEAVAAPDAPPLPWPWTTLDPMEVGRRAYRNYWKGGCGLATYLAFVSLLKEKVGYPWTNLPDMMMIHAGSGYGGHGTLCGTLGGTSLIINLVAYDRSVVLVVRGAGVSDRQIRRHLRHAGTGQSQGHVTAVPYLGLEVDRDGRHRGDLQSEARALRQGGG